MTDLFSIGYIRIKGTLPFWDKGDATLLEYRPQGRPKKCEVQNKG